MKALEKRTANPSLAAVIFVSKTRRIKVTRVAKPPGHNQFVVTDSPPSRLESRYLGRGHLKIGQTLVSYGKGKTSGR